jgi:NADH-quinone oxidoreductase subunit J
MTEAVCFWVFASLMLLSALGVILARFPVYSVLLLLVSMCCVAGLFVLQGAFFLAALQVLIYAGAILVLFLFAIMLLNLDPAQWQAPERVRTLRLIGGLVALAFLAELAWIARQAAASVPAAGSPAPGTVAAIGRSLLREYLLPFELTSFLILAAIIGAVALAKLKVRD